MKIKAKELKVGDKICGYVVDHLHLSSHCACIWGHGFDCDEVELSLPLELRVNVERVTHVEVPIKFLREVHKILKGTEFNDIAITMSDFIVPEVFNDHKG